MKPVSSVDEVYNEVENSIRQTDYARPLASFVETARQNSVRAFATETSIDGTPWNSWYFAQAGVLQTNPDHKTLHVTGTLMDSVVNHGAGHIESIDRDSAVWGTAVDYAGIHQEGGSETVETLLVSRDRKFAKHPGSTIEIEARPFIGVTEDQVNEFTNRVADHVVNELLKGLV